METKQVRSRLLQKTDISENWKIAGDKGFVPLKGELIIYSDKNNLKVGDGQRNVNQLEFMIADDSDVEKLERKIAELEKIHELIQGAKPFAENYNFNTHALGYASHAEGSAITENIEDEDAEETCVHVFVTPEGELKEMDIMGSTAYGHSSHAEGSNTLAYGHSAHAEGTETTAAGGRSHAEGTGTQALGHRSHAEGGGTVASGIDSHAEGTNTQVIGRSAHGEGMHVNYSTIPLFYTEEDGTTAESIAASHLQKRFHLAYGRGSHIEGASNLSFGENSHAEGRYNQALGARAHVEGYNSVASGNQSHAEGNSTIASSDSAHAEGYYSIASGQYSHAEGGVNEAKGRYSHAEGFHTIASNLAQHTQGRYNVVDESGNATTQGTYVHIVGGGSKEDVLDENGNVVTQNRKNIHTLDWKGNAWFQGEVYVSSSSGINKDSGSKKLTTKDEVEDLVNDAIKDINLEGCATEEYVDNKAKNHYVVAGRKVDTAAGERSTAEGKDTTASGYTSHAEGYMTSALGRASHSEGGNSKTGAGAEYAHAEGNNTSALNKYSHAEGSGSTAGDEDNTNAYAMHAEGINTAARGSGAHTEGVGTLAEAQGSHAEGDEINSINVQDDSGNRKRSGPQAAGRGAHAEGTGTKAMGLASHAEGVGSSADGIGAHAEGYDTQAKGKASHAEGQGTIANGLAQHVQGQYNEALGDNYLHILGNGSSSKRSNAHTIDKNGNAWFAGDIYIGGKKQEEGAKLITENDLATEEKNGLISPEDRFKIQNAIYDLDDIATVPYSLEVNRNAYFKNDIEVSGDASIRGRITGINNGIDPKDAVNKQQLDEIKGLIVKLSIHDNEIYQEGEIENYELSHNGTEIYNAISKGKPVFLQFESSTQFYNNDEVVLEILANSIYNIFRHQEGILEFKLEKDYIIRIYESGAVSVVYPSINEPSQPCNGGVGQTSSNGTGEIFNDYENNYAGRYAHAEGGETAAEGSFSHAEGLGSIAYGYASHAENASTARGSRSHAEGNNTSALAVASHAEGTHTSAKGDYSHVEGGSCETIGMYSHAEGFHTVAASAQQHVQGRYNIEDTVAADDKGKYTTRGKFAHIIGNGNSGVPSNAHTVDWNGNGWYSGAVYTGQLKNNDLYDEQGRLVTVNELNNALKNVTPQKEVVIVTITDNIASHTSNQIHESILKGEAVYLLYNQEFLIPCSFCSFQLSTFTFQDETETRTYYEIGDDGGVSYSEIRTVLSSEMEENLGNIEAALEAIIAIQNSIIGGAE